MGPGVGTFIASIALVITVSLCSGCASSVGGPSTIGESIQKDGGEQSDTLYYSKKVSEDEIDNYLRTAYTGISPAFLSIEEQELIKDEEFLANDLTEFERELDDFMKKKLPYINLKDPTPKDLSFLLRYGDVVYCYREYLAIDMSRLSQDEINSIRQFRRVNASGKIDPRDFSGWESAALESLRIFTDFQNMSDRDIVLFHRVGIRLPKSSAGPARSVWSQ